MGRTGERQIGPRAHVLRPLKADLEPAIFARSVQLIEHIAGVAARADLCAVQPDSRKASSMGDASGQVLLRHHTVVEVLPTRGKQWHNGDQYCFQGIVYRVYTWYEFPTASGEFMVLSTRERILAGAAEVIAANGLRGSTVQDILKASSVSRRTFYLHFPNSEGVTCDLYILKMGELVERMTTEAASQADPREKLLSSMNAYVDFQQAGGPLLIRLQTEAVRPESQLSPIREQTLDVLVALVSSEAEGVLSVRLNPLLLRALLIGVEGLMIHLQQGGELSDASADEARTVVGEMLVDALTGSVMRKGQ